jgi:hypothetical protein
MFASPGCPTKTVQLQNCRDPLTTGAKPQPTARAKRTGGIETFQLTAKLTANRAGISMFVLPLDFRFLLQANRFKLGCLLLICCAVMGCGRSESIRSYTPPELERGAYELDRMLGAIVPLGETTWFFKLQGKDEAVHNQQEAFVKFVQTVRAPKDSPKNLAKAKNGEPEPPTWKAPSEWVAQRPSNRMIHQSYLIPVSGARPLKLDVSMLPTPERGFDDRYLKENISRWCRQYGQDGISEREIPEHSTKIVLKDLRPKGGEAWIVNLSGIFAGSSGMMAALAPEDNSDPHAGLKEPVDPAGDQPGAPTASASGIQVQVPADWKPGKPGGFIPREVSLAAVDGDMTADIYITRLTASNELAGNIARWRGQVGLPDLPATELEASAQKITVDGMPGHFVALVGAEKTILGAMVKKGSDAWFFKLDAPNALAAKEQAKFEEFVRTTKLP